MLIFWSVCNDACQWVLNALKFVEIRLWDARIKWIAIVKFAGDKRICKSCGCRKRKKMTDSTDVSDVKMTRFGNRVICSEKDMSESKMKPRLRAEELTGMISLLRGKFVRSENLRRCCFVPIRRNSVLDGLRSNLFKFIQERMSVKVVVFQVRDSTYHNSKLLMPCV